MPLSRSAHKKQNLPEIKLDLHEIGDQGQYHPTSGIHYRLTWNKAYGTSFTRYKEIRILSTDRFMFEVEEHGKHNILIEEFKKVEHNFPAAKYYYIDNGERCYLN